MGIFVSQFSPLNFDRSRLQTLRSYKNSNSPTFINFLVPNNNYHFPPFYTTSRVIYGNIHDLIATTNLKLFSTDCALTDGNFFQSVGLRPHLILLGQVYYPPRQGGRGGMDPQFFLGLSHLIYVWKFVQFYFSIGKFEDIFLNEYICWIYFLLTTIGNHQFFHLGAVLIWFDFVLDLMIEILLLFWYMFKLKITWEESISFFYVT